MRVSAGKSRYRYGLRPVAETAGGDVSETGDPNPGGEVAAAVHDGVLSYQKLFGVADSAVR